MARDQRRYILVLDGIRYFTRTARWTEIRSLAWQMSKKDAEEWHRSLRVLNGSAVTIEPVKPRPKLLERAHKHVMKERPYRLYLKQSFRDKNARRRGRLIMSFYQYRDLVSMAKHLTELAMYPKSRWMDLYDWNEVR